MINIRKFLNENADFGYAQFNKKFVTTKYAIVGVRIPKLRKFAKEIEPEYIDLEANPTYEEILLYGFSAGNIKSEDEQLEYLQNVLPYIDNWSTCDCIVTSLKKMTGEKSYQFLTSLLADEREFYVRVGIVGLMRFFLKTDKVDEILKNIRKITAQGYYVKMAIAWLLAELCAINFEKAKKFISEEKDPFIRNRAISKARESFRVSQPQKDELATLRIKQNENLN